MQITDLSPERVFTIFSEISEIPHGSGNTEKITEYITDFAKARGLKYQVDGGGNIFIYKPATKGRDDSEPVILQGHIDMVCAKTADCTKDMQKDGLALLTDGEFVWADGTTLGADNGIAVAYILAILEADDIAHPPITALLTNDEETGMIGARELDSSLLNGQRLINIDSEEEGIFTVSCAGGLRAVAKIPITKMSATGFTALRIEIGGLLGGHSGIDIGKNRTNAIKLAAHVLDMLPDNFFIADFELDGKTNVIPNRISVTICVAQEDAEGFINEAERIAREKADELAPNEAGFTLRAVSADSVLRCADDKSTKIIINTLLKTPDGVQTIVGDKVQSSLNLGTIELFEDVLELGYMIRSNVSAEHTVVGNALEATVKNAGGSVTFDGYYPPWEYRENSPLRDVMTDAYIEMYGKEPLIESIHAGLECGILSSSDPLLDMVSFGPDMFDVHTPKERLGVKSAQRCWEYLKLLLAKL